MRIVAVAPFERDGRFLASVAGHLAADKGIDRVICLSDSSGPWTNRTEAWKEGMVEWRTVDFGEDLIQHMRYVDAVICLGWSGNRYVRALDQSLSRVARVCASVVAAEVTTFVFGSSAIVYSPAPSEEPVDEHWPTSGLAGFPFARRMAVSEWIVDGLERDHEIIRVVRLRHGVVMLPPVVATGGPVRPRLRRALLATPFVPDLQEVTLQAVHIADLAEAYRLALTESVAGPYNVAADPITSKTLAAALGARTLPMPKQWIRSLLRLRDRRTRFGSPVARMALTLQMPHLDTARARRDLGWEPRYSGVATAREWVASQRAEHEGGATPPRTQAPGVPRKDNETRGAYLEALSFFGRTVHAIDALGWRAHTPVEESLLQVLAEAAREQYRVALLAKGRGADEVERELPGDPLGIHPIDGWDLAAERAEIALGGRGSGDGNDETSAALPPELENLLVHRTADLVRWGRSIADMVGADVQLAPELTQFA